MAEVLCALGYGECPVVCQGHTVSETLWKNGVEPDRTARKMDLATGTVIEGDHSKTLFKSCRYEKGGFGRQQTS